MIPVLIAVISISVAVVAFEMRLEALGWTSIAVTVAALLVAA